MFHWLFQRTGEFFNLWRELFEDSFSWEDPKTKLQNQLRSMYGRGEVTSERFLDLRAHLDRGQIGLGDIQLVQQEALHRTRTIQPLDGGHSNREIERSLERLYIDLGLVEEARAGILRSQQAITNDANWVEEQASFARVNARAALPDEGLARAHLETWQRLAQWSQGIDLRRQAMSRELQRLDEMQAEIKAAILRLQLLGSAEKLAVLRLHVRQDLFAGGGIPPQKR